MLNYVKLFRSIKYKYITEGRLVVTTVFYEEDNKEVLNVFIVSAKNYVISMRLEICYICC